MQIRGIKRGQTIELTEDLAIPDGREIMIEINLSPALDSEEHWQKFCQLFGVWSDQPDLDATFAAIDGDRHQHHGRKSLDFD